MDWRSARTLVTGGASFIGSHLVDALVAKGAKVRVVDNLSSGRLDNIRPHVDAGRVEFIEGDLNDQHVVEQSVRGVNVVFHLAADHGGRGYVDLHQVACATNLVLDGLVFKACHKARRRQGRLRLVRLRLSEPPADRPRPDPLSHRRHGRPAVRRGQPVRLGEAHGRDDAPRLHRRDRA